MSINTAQNHMKFSPRDEGDVIVPGHHYLFNWVKPSVIGKKVLDIGCWSGVMECLLKDVDCQVTGIDLEPEPLEFAKKKFPQYRFVQSSVSEPMPFENGEFDTVLYFMVIEHVPIGTELASLKNINKVTKIGGELYMNTMNSNLISNLIDPAYFFGHRHYSKNHLQQMLTEAGFEVKEVKYNAGWFTTLHIALLYFFKHVLRRKEPRNKFMDRLMWLDYRDRGFAEIDIKATKIKDIS